MTLLEQWVTWNRPWWQKIHQEAVQKGDSRREAYARWMLQEVLGQQRNKGKEEGNCILSLT